MLRMALWVPWWRIKSLSSCLTLIFKKTQRSNNVKMFKWNQTLSGQEWNLPSRQSTLSHSTQQNEHICSFRGCKAYNTFCFMSQQIQFLQSNIPVEVLLPQTAYQHPFPKTVTRNLWKPEIVSLGELTQVYHL